MRIEVNKNVLAGALIALGKLVCRTSPVEVYRCVQIEKKNEWLYLRTCNPDEMMEFKTGCESEGEFASVIPFDEFRNAVKGSKNKMLAFECDAGVLQIDGKAVMEIKAEWPKVCECPVETFPKVLPENFIGLLAKAAPIVNRNEPRRVLQGINLSKDGITVTNGKELVNIDCPLDVENLTIPFPLALLSTKADASGLLFVWTNGKDVFFKVIVQGWAWTSKALPGTYPNWKQVIPAAQYLTHSVSFLPERGEQLAIFLKNVSDNPPLNAVEVFMSGTEYLNLKVGNMNTSVAAKSPCDWGDFDFQIDKNLLLRLLSAGHTKIEACDNHAPIVASGGIGRYIAMPLYRNVEPKIEPETQSEQEESKMNEMNPVVSAPVPTVTPNINHEPEAVAVNPLDDLVNGIETFKNKLKAAFDETSLLARKVKEIQLAQKQKERDFVLAKRAIERIRMVSSF